MRYDYPHRVLVRLNLGSPHIRHTHLYNWIGSSSHNETSHKPDGCTTNTITTIIGKSISIHTSPLPGGPQSSRPVLGQLGGTQRAGWNGPLAPNNLDGCTKNIKRFGAFCAGSRVDGWTRARPNRRREQSQFPTPTRARRPYTQVPGSMMYLPKGRIHTWIHTCSARFTTVVQDPPFLFIVAQHISIDSVLPRVHTCPGTEVTAKMPCILCLHEIVEILRPPPSVCLDTGHGQRNSIYYYSTSNLGT